MNADGSGTVETLVSGLTTVDGIALDVAGGKIYWIEAGPSAVNMLRRVNIEIHPNKVTRVLFKEIIVQ